MHCYAIFLYNLLKKIENMRTITQYTHKHIHRYVYYAHHKQFPGHEFHNFALKG